MLATNYRTAEPSPSRPAQGRVSRYAWSGADYHDVIRRRLLRLEELLRKMAPKAKARGVVDTAPLLERDFARLAGLGWIGKNTMLLNKAAGSWLFLSALLTDQQLQYDSPHASRHCGTCRACLDACPTGALPQPYVLDAPKCISYLTIELRGAMPTRLRSSVGDWLFGCDACQEVCPWNRRPPAASDPLFQPAAELNPVGLVELFALGDREFRARFRQSPLWRAKRGGILRNAAIVLGNQRPAEALETLAQGLADHDPLVRGACAWALGQYNNPRAHHELRRRLAVEPHPEVRHEITAALAGWEMGEAGRGMGDVRSETGIWDEGCGMWDVR
jgi:epoxyqueuosine reductase